jgi:hypothetical protein
VGTWLLFVGNLAPQPSFNGVEHRSISDLAHTDKLLNDAFWPRRR